MPGRVWLLDASALIECKQRIAVGDQWDFFKTLEERVEAGEIAVPRQVINEVTSGRWPDAPGVWAGGMRGKLAPPFIDTPLALVRTVLDATPDLIEEDAAGEPGDPYLVAMALALMETGEYEPMIVTEDLVDRVPFKLSLRSAAVHHGVEWCTLQQFADALDYKCKPRPGVTPSD